MLDMRETLTILGVAVAFFGIFYTFISLAMGQPMHLRPLVFCVLIVSVASGAVVAFVYTYKGNDVKNEIGE